MEMFSKKSKFQKCFITNIIPVKNEIEIWCQTDIKMGSRVEISIDLVHKKLSDLFAINSQNLRPVPTPEVGKNYLTHMKNDLHFYRVVVTHIESSEALVLFMDFGVEDWVPFNHLVEFEPLFDIQPLAQKFFLADINTKDNEWNSDEVKRCIQPFLMSVFNCEVISIHKNTECLRIYDQFFNQPLVQSLVKHCNGFLCYPSVGNQIFEAIDLRDDKINVFKQIDNNFSEVNEFSEKQINGSEPKTPELSPKCNKFIDKLKMETTVTTNGFPSDRSESNESTDQLITGEEDHSIGLSDELSINLQYKASQNREQNNSLNGSIVIENEEILEKAETKEQLSDSKEKLEETNFELSPQSKNEVKETTIELSVDSPDEISVNDSKPSEKKSFIESVSEETVIDKINTEVIEVSKEVTVNGSHDFNSNKPNETESKVATEWSDIKLKVNTDFKADLPKVSVNTSGDAPQEVINEELDELKESQNVSDLNLVQLKHEFIGKKQSIYASTKVSEQSFYFQLCSQFDEIIAMTEKMTAFYNQFNVSDKYSLNLNEIKINDIIAARYSEDMLWYRASVLSINGNQLTVIYIDYGNEEKVEFSDCKQLTEEFTTKVMEPLAYHCSVIEPNISGELIDKYVNDLVELECNFCDIENNIFKIKIISK